MNGARKKLVVGVLLVVAVALIAWILFASRVAREAEEQRAPAQEPSMPSVLPQAEVERIRKELTTPPPREITEQEKQHVRQELVAPPPQTLTEEEKARIRQELTKPPLQ
jgi:flagellar biosynthesis/type III secretory pathway M-ring protein FliF/YscJ